MTTNSINNDPFAHLPLFASDLEIAMAIVGAKNAARWVRDKPPTLSKKPGFPAVDDFHGGRPVPLVRLFYNNYLGIRDGMTGVPGGKEAEWSTLKRRG
jgi:hypothetical protein